MRRVVVGFAVVIGLGLTGSGVAKLLGAADVDRDRLAIATWLWMAVGTIEVVGGLGMLAGLKRRRLAVASAMGVAALTLAALAAHIRAGDSPAMLVPPLIVFGMALSIAAVRAEACLPGGTAAMSIGRGH